MTKDILLTCTCISAASKTKTHSQVEDVGFVMMSHVFHQFLHVREGTTAADGGAQQDLS